MKRSYILVVLAVSALAIGVYFAFQARSPLGSDEDDSPVDNSIVTTSKVVFVQKNPFHTPAIKQAELMNDSSAYLDYIERISAEVLKKTGHFYADAHWMRKFHQRYGPVDFPRLQLNLHIKTDSGQIVPLTTTGFVQFDWIHDKYNGTEIMEIADTEGFSERIQSRYFLRRGKKLLDLADEYDIELLRNTWAYGVKSISLPILPAGYIKHFPELAKYRVPLNVFNSFLRADSWYELSIYVFDKDWAGMGSTIDLSKNRTSKVVTYFKTPSANELKMGKTIAVDYLITKNAKPPFKITSNSAGSVGGKPDATAEESQGSPFGIIGGYSKDGSLERVEETDKEKATSDE